MNIEVVAKSKIGQIYTGKTGVTTASIDPTERDIEHISVLHIETN